jgi:hypothetical protein
MKKSILLAASLLALNLSPVCGQDHYTLAFAPGNQPNLEATNLTKFNLDFPGGTPAQLIKAIEKATGKPLNAIIPDEDADMKLPSLKLNDITFPQLSETLRQGSFKTEYIRTSNGSFQSVSFGYYFKTTDGTPSDNSVWFFFDQKSPPPPPVEKVCQFYSLSPYLDRGFTVDDITTAIQTGWKMAGITPTPELNYHKETKLLIAFGEPDKLKTIQNVLQTLPTSNATRNELDKLEKGMNKLTDIVSTLQGEVAQHDIKLNQIPMSAPSTIKMPEEKSGK